MTICSSKVNKRKGPSKMSLYSFEIVDTIAHKHSFAKAAEVLNITPSAVSHAVNKLEKELNLQFFVRSRRGVPLTKDGEQLLPYIHAIHQYCELFYLEVEQIHGNSKGSVRLGTFNSVTIAWLPQLIKAFRSEYPDIDISVHQGSHLDIVNWLLNDEVDLAFLINDIVPSGVDSIPIHKDALVCITPPDYTPLGGDHVTAEDISQMNLIFQQNGYDTEVLDYLKQNNIRVHPSFYIESDAAMVALVAAGIGSCIVPEMVTFALNPNVKIYPITPPAYRIIHLASVRHPFPAPATTALRQMILRYVEQTGIKNI